MEDTFAILGAPFLGNILEINQRKSCDIKGCYIIQYTIKNLTKRFPLKNLFKNRSFHNVEKNTLHCLLSAFECFIFIRFIPNHTMCLYAILLIYCVNLLIIFHIEINY
jgi:hypothetical protein